MRDRLWTGPIVLMCLLWVLGFVMGASCHSKVLGSLEGAATHVEAVRE